MIEEISDFLISLLPSNNFAFLIYLILITFFSILLIFYLSRKVKKEEFNNKKEKLNIDDLIKIANNPNSTLKDLAFVLEYFLEYFKVENNEKKSFELFRKVLNHKNRNKILFDIYHGKILPLNLKYKDVLDKIEKEALNRD